MNLTPQTHKMDNSSSKSKPLPSLTQDLITEILFRLPAKPLARFKCVSKQWHSLINSRYFILTHITRASHSLPALQIARFNFSELHTLPLASLNPSSSSPPPKPDRLSLPFKYKSFDADIFGSAHGLLGISDYPKFLSLYNPTNKTLKVIPHYPLKPIVEAHWIDFSLGYDSLSDDYKIVMVNQPNEVPTLPREVWVYSLKAPTWRKLDQNFPHYLAYSKGSNSNGKYLANAILFLWVGAVNPPKLYNSNTMMNSSGQTGKWKWGNVYLLVEFDISTDKFRVSELPGFDSDGTYYGFKSENTNDCPRPMLVVLGSDLMVQVEFGPIDKRVVEVWLKKGYGVKGNDSKWVKLLRFPYMVARPKADAMGGVKPVMVSDCGEVVLMEQKSSYFWFNVRSGEFRDVKIDGFLPELFQWVGGCGYQCQGVVYVESLLGLNNSGLELAADVPGDDDGYGIMIQGKDGRLERMSMTEFHKRFGKSK